MDFNQPDPEQIINNLKAAFQAAADNSTGAAKPKFQRLSDAFNKFADKAATIQADSLQEALPLMKMEFLGFIMAMMQVQQQAKTDPAVRKTLQDLNDTIRQDTQGILGGLLGGLGGLDIPGLGGLDIPGFGGPKDTTPKPPVKKDPPKKPGDGDWKL